MNSKRLLVSVEIFSHQDGFVHKHETRSMKSDRLAFQKRILDGNGFLMHQVGLLKLAHSYVLIWKKTVVEKWLLIIINLCNDLSVQTVAIWFHIIIEFKIQLAGTASACVYECVIFFSLIVLEWDEYQYPTAVLKMRRFNRIHTCVASYLSEKFCSVYLYVVLPMI